jgi:hypothetical protein
MQGGRAWTNCRNIADLGAAIGMGPRLCQREGRLRRLLGAIQFRPSRSDLFGARCDAIGVLAVKVKPPSAVASRTLTAPLAGVSAAWPGPLSVLI